VPPQHRDGSDDLIPASLLVTLVRDVWQPLEVKVVLTLAALGGVNRPVAEEDLLRDEPLQAGARADGSGRPALERVWEALERAVTRGVVLRLVDEDEQYWLLLGTEENQRRSRAGRSESGQRLPPWEGRLTLERPSIFTLYEQNIGLVTPIIADRLVEAVDRYPEQWIEEAIAEAVAYNRRNWRYVQRILENWATEGRADEANRGTATRDVNREKHLRGKYAHLFGRDGLPDLPGRGLPADGRDGR
jgi:DNA replication protein